jgi:hypothetical protein
MGAMLILWDQGGRDMGIGFGVVAVAVGVLMLWAGCPSGPVHNVILKSTLREELYIFLVLSVALIGVGLLIRAPSISRPRPRYGERP